MGIGRVPRAYSLVRGGEQAGPLEDIGFLSEEAEDQPCHETVHVLAALGGSPFGVVLQQLDVELVQAASGPDIERAFADLLDSRDPREGQEETEVVREI